MLSAQHTAYVHAVVDIHNIHTYVVRLLYF